MFVDWSEESIGRKIYLLNVVQSARTEFKTVWWNRPRQAQIWFGKLGPI